MKDDQFGWKIFRVVRVGSNGSVTFDDGQGTMSPHLDGAKVGETWACLIVPDPPWAFGRLAEARLLSTPSSGKLTADELAEALCRPEPGTPRWRLEDESVVKFRIDGDKLQVTEMCEEHISMSLTKAEALALLEDLRTLVQLIPE